MDDPEDKEAAEALSTAQPKIPEMAEPRFRLRGVRAGRQTKTTQYGVVWGVHPNRSSHWFNEDDVQISMPCEPHSQDLALQGDMVRGCAIRSGIRKGRNVCEYQIEKFGLDGRTWTTEDRLRISLSPSLVAELKASFHPSSESQREVLRHAAAPISDECRQASRASRPSALGDPALGSKSATLKRGYQDAHTEISSDTHLSANKDDNHNACDTSDEDQRPAKRRKSRSAPAVTLTTSRGHTPKLHLGQPGTPLALSTATPEVDDPQPHAEDRCSVTFVDHGCHYSSSSWLALNWTIKAINLRKRSNSPIGADVGAKISLSCRCWNQDGDLVCSF